VKHRVLTYQSYDATTTEYVEHFKVQVGIVETYGGVYGNEPGLIKAQLTKKGVAAEEGSRGVLQGVLVVHDPARIGQHQVLLTQD
jgi:hypothetical protein